MYTLQRFRGYSFLALALLALVGCGGGGGDVQSADSESRPAPVYEPFTALGTLPAKEEVTSRKVFLDFAAVGNLLYVVEGTGGLRIVDTTDLNRPLVVAKISAETPLSADRDPMFLQRQPDRLLGVAANQTLAAVSVFVGDPIYNFSSCACTEPEGELRLYDVSNPASPQLLSTVRQGAASSMVLDGKYLYALRTNTPYHPDLMKENLGWLDTIDVSDPSRPRIVGTVPTFSTGKLIKRGDTLYLAYTGPYSGGLQGVQTLDVSSAERPLITKSFGGAGWPPGDSEPALVGTTLYAADGGARIQLFAMTDETPTATNFSVEQTAEELAVKGKSLYVSQGSKGIAVFDISDQSKLTLLRLIATPGKARSVKVFDTYGFAILSEETRPDASGFFVLLTAPERLSFFAIPDAAR